MEEQYKCKCGCTETEIRNYCYDENSGDMSYAVFCKQCGELLDEH